MLNSLKNFDQRLGGWPSTILRITIEILVIYGVSSIPFIFTALEGLNEQATSNSFFRSFITVLKDEVAKGQLLTFVCTLIAPVLLWSLLEFKKAIQTKILNSICLILIALCAYIHGKGGGFSTPSSFHLYIVALAVWVASIIAREFPPSRTPYSTLANEEAESFVEASRKV